MTNYAEKLITHQHTITKDVNLADYQEKLHTKSNLILPLHESLALLEQLNEFELGRFLLKNKGLNGYWTAYIILYSLDLKPANALEKWFLHDAPVVKAMRERFAVFNRFFAEHLRDNITIASIPCGVMDDLISLDSELFENVHYVGIDYDAASLHTAMQKSKHLKKTRVSFAQQDAWDLQYQNAFDVVASNGLNFYEPDDQRVIALYQQFYKSLKPQGTLITSFLTPPPTLSIESTWKNYEALDLKKQAALFVDIIEGAWQAFRTEAQTKQQLEAAGFLCKQFIYDSQGMFPSVIAVKP